VLSHGVKEDLVERASHWPGANCVRALCEGEPPRGTWYDRTGFYRGSRWGGRMDSSEFVEVEEVRLSALPCWAHLSGREIRRRVRSMIEMAEAEARARHRAQGTRPAGVRALLAHGATERPKHLKCSPRPWFHARTRARREKMREAYRLFVKAFRRAAADLAAGRTQPAFPQGSFPPGQPFVPHLVPG